MMTPIKIADLKHGTIADKDYFSEKGELLIGTGTLIQKEHLDAFRRRNILSIYINAIEEDAELHALLNRDFSRFSDLDTDEFGELSPDLAPAPADGPLIFTDLSVIKSGKEGFDQLLRSHLVHNLDRHLSSDITGDVPDGPAFKATATQLTPAQRSPQYKETVLKRYDDALEQTRATLQDLASGGMGEGRGIRSTVEQFVSLYATDKDILLNISCSKNADYEYLYHHSLNVCLLSINIAASAGYSERQIIEIGIGALLHDIGMLLVPPHIRCKEGRLSDQEWFEIQKHPVLGLHLMEKIVGLPLSAQFIAYQVHERDNGNGYPKQRKGRLIHRYARIVQIADIYEAMSSPRSYRKSWLPHEATSGLLKMTKVGLLSGDLVKSFLEYTSLFPVGCVVELSDHSIGRVIHANYTSFAKPIISVLTEPGGKPLERTRIHQVDLSTDPYLRILRAFGSDRLKPSQLMDGF